MNEPIGSLAVEREKHDVIVLIETRGGETIEGHIGPKQALEIADMFREAGEDAAEYVLQNTEEYE